MISILKKAVFAVVIGTVFLSSGVMAEELGAQKSDITEEKVKKLQPNKVCDLYCYSYMPKDRSWQKGYIANAKNIDFLAGRITCNLYNSSDLDHPIGTYSYIDPDCSTIFKARFVASGDKGVLKNLSAWGGATVDTEFKKANTSNFLSLSKTMTVLMTMDPDYIDYTATEQRGRLVYKGGYKDAIDLISAEVSKNNSSNAAENLYIGRVKDIYGFILGFFLSLNDLYNNINTFMLAGAISMMLLMLGGQAAFKKLQRQDGTHPNYLQYIVVGMLGVMLFYAPIPVSQNNGSNTSNSAKTTTTIQTIIRYFAEIGNDWAEEANIIGAKEYTKYLIKSNGLYTQEVANTMKQTLENNRKKLEIYNSIYKKCKADYSVGKASTYRSFEDADSKSISENAVRKKSKNGKNIFEKIPVFPPEVCLDAERSITILNVQNKDLARQIAKFDLNKNNSSATNKFKNKVMDVIREIKKSNSQSGWLGASFMPSAILWFQASSDVGEKAREDEVNRKVKDSGNDQANKSEGESEGKSYVKSALMSVPYLMLPGGKAVFDIMEKIVDAVGGKLIMGILPIAMLSNPLVGFMLFFASNIIELGVSMYATVYVMTQVILYFPIVALIVSAIIKSIMFFVDLFKLMYVSPFVVLWAFSMKSPHKIMNFAIKAASLMITPSLIVLSAYLAIMLKTVVEDLFLVMIFKQFAYFESIGDPGFLKTSFILMFKEFILIICEMAAAYIAIRMIISGSDMFLKMLGVDDSGNVSKEITSQVTQKVSSRSEIV